MFFIRKELFAMSEKERMLEQLFLDVNFLDLNVTFASGHMSIEGARALDVIRLLLEEEKARLAKTA